jgi:hypothetical protein
LALIYQLRLLLTNFLPDRLELDMKVRRPATGINRKSESNSPALALRMDGREIVRYRITEISGNRCFIVDEPFVASV